MSSKHRFATEEIEKFSTLDLISELKRRYQVLSRPERSCVILGAPNSGVSSEAGFLRKEWGLCSIKREDFLPKDDTDLNVGLNKLSEEISSFRCRRGFAIQHFPQSSSEAALLDQMISAKHEKRKDYKVILLTMPHETDEERVESEKTLTSRATGHLVHQPSGRCYNSNVSELAPQTANVDDITGEPLVCPKNDLSGLAYRIKTWWQTQEPSIASYYGSRAQKVDAAKSRDQVSKDVSRILLTTTCAMSGLSGDRTETPISILQDRE
jgi:adenylate kinase